MIPPFDSTGASLLQEKRMAAGKKIEIQFEHEKNDDGTLKVTSGRKHRFKEKVNPEAGLGMVIGTLYVAEHVVAAMGNPDNFTIAITPDVKS
jgi:hypothetical protein